MDDEAGQRAFAESPAGRGHRSPRGGRVSGPLIRRRTRRGSGARIWEFGEWKTGAGRSPFNLGRLGPSPTLGGDQRRAGRPDDPREVGPDARRRGKPAPEAPAATATAVATGGRMRAGMRPCGPRASNNDAGGDQPSGPWDIATRGLRTWLPPAADGPSPPSRCCRTQTRDVVIGGPQAGQGLRDRTWPERWRVPAAR